MRYVIAALAAVCLSSPAAADGWWSAKTNHFVVYSETSKEQAEQLAVNLERFDQVMRYVRGMPLESEEVPDSAKLTLYQFGDTDDIGELAGSRGVAGFFIPRAGGSVAFVPARQPRVRGSIGTRDTDDSFSGVVLFHEYAHYFMYQHAPAAYPRWYSEGFAEVYGTAQLTDSGFRLGGAATHRADVLRYLNTYHVKRLLDPPERLDGEDGAQIYALGWLLSNYLSFSGERKGQLEQYLRLINAGQTSRQAAEQAFGDLDKLNRDLDAYRRGRARIVEVKFPNYTPPRAQVRALSQAEEAKMRLHIRSQVGVSKEKAKALVDDARRLATAYPTDVPVLRAAMEAEYDAQNDREAEALADRILQLDPANTDAHIYRARVALRRAKSDPKQFAVARKEFVAANKSDNENPVPLHGYYLTYQLAGETPPRDALIAVERAYEFAPFDPGIRRTLAHLMVVENRNKEALALLGPIINDPHPKPGKRLTKLREISKQIEAGNRTEALKELAPKLDEQKEDEDED